MRLPIRLALLLSRVGKKPASLLCALGRRDTLVAFFLYALILGAYFQPLFTSMGTHVPGDCFILGQYGNMIFYDFDFTHGFQIPFHTDLQKYPQGGYLIFNAWANILFIAVLRNFLSLPVVFNLSIILSFLLAPMAAYALARDLFRNKGAAFIAGLIYGFHPIIQSAVTNGQIEQLHHGWLPLYLLFLLRAVNGGAGVLNCLGLAVSLLACYMNFPYFAVYALMFTAIIFAHRLLSKRESRAADLRVMGLLLFVIAAVSVLPLTYYRALTVIPVDKLILTPADIAVKQQPLPPEKTPHIDVVNLFVPPKMRQLPVLVGCLGNVFIPLLLFSFVKARKKGHVPWLAAFCVFLGLSIGPVLLVGGKVVTLYGQPVVTPYLLLQKLIPGLFAGVWTYRFLYGAILSLSLLVASELALYLGRLPALSRHFFLLLFCAASFSALFQPAALPYPVRLTSVEVPMIYRLIAAEKDDFAIMEFPDQLEGLDPHLLPTQWYFQKLSTYQLVHRKKMGNSCSRFPNLQARSSLFFTDCLRFIDSSQAGSGGRSAGVEWFRANNFKYFIVHEDFIPRRTVQELMAYVTENLGPPVFSDDDIAVFSFRPRGSRAR